MHAHHCWVLGHARTALVVYVVSYAHRHLLLLLLLPELLLCKLLLLERLRLLLLRLLLLAKLLLLLGLHIGHLHWMLHLLLEVGWHAATHLLGKLHAHHVLLLLMLLLGLHILVEFVLHG